MILNNQLPKDIYEIFEKSYGFTPDNFHYDLLNHVHGRDCYCAKGTSTYKGLLAIQDATSDLVACLLTGNNPSNRLCVGLKCPGGEWVRAFGFTQFAANHYASSVEHCIKICSFGVYMIHQTNDINLILEKSKELLNCKLWYE